MKNECVKMYVQSKIYFVHKYMELILAEKMLSFGQKCVCFSVDFCAD